MNFFKLLSKIVCVLVLAILNVSFFQIFISKSNYNMFIYTMNNINEVLFDSKKVINTNRLNAEQNVYIYNNTYSFEEPLNQNEFLYLTYEKTFDQKSGFQDTKFNIEQYIRKDKEKDLSLKINSNINNANNVNYDIPIAKSTFNFSLEVDPHYDYYEIINEILPFLQNNFLNKVYQKSIYSKNYWGNFSNNISYNYLFLNLNENKAFKTLPNRILSLEDEYNYYFYSGFNNYLNRFSICYD